MWVGLAALVAAGVIGLGGCAPAAVNPSPPRLPTVVIVPTATSVPSPTSTGAAMPTRTASHTPTPLPTPSATQRIISPPVLIAPVHGVDAGSNPELEWQDIALPSDHFFIVRLRDPSGAVVTSPMLTTPHWRPALPPDKAGWWSWTVQVVQNTGQGITLVTTSREWTFWFGPTPTPASGRPRVSPTPGRLYESPTPTQSVG